MGLGEVPRRIANEVAMWRLSLTKAERAILEQGGSLFRERSSGPKGTSWESRWVELVHLVDGGVEKTVLSHFPSALPVLPSVSETVDNIPFGIEEAVARAIVPISLAAFQWYLVEEMLERDRLELEWIIEDPSGLVRPGGLNFVLG